MAKEKRTKIIKLSEDYTVDYLLQFGIDHLRSAKYLYEGSPSFFDSAGYLSQLGIEVLLKAWLLYCKGEHPTIHVLRTLFDELIASGQNLSLTQESEECLTNLDEHYGSRYPQINPIETGSDDWVKTETLFSELCLLMPEPLQEKIRSLDDTKKNGRVLMKKKDR